VLSLDELAAIAHGLAESAHLWPGVTDPERRTWHTIAETDRFEAFVIAWPAGASIDLHDHGDAAGVVAVTAGELVETIALDVGGSSTLRSRRLTTGELLAFGTGHVHELTNTGSTPALSVHVYSPVLRSMTFYEHRPGRGRLLVRTEQFEHEERR
jgi:predicted metal-dependent enzyme (double-stranded beta helix superfamily)